ncbi:MAG: hypothetical protein M3T55_01780 [Pseudomonadota bacterium]|nr:hypothetical protein [Pseudomonadota bacterium]
MSERARDIEWQYLDSPTVGAIQVGERVSAAAGGLPIYRVMALGGGRAWLHDAQSGADKVMPITHFHWKATPA